MSRKVSTPEFKKLLFAINDRRPDVRIRIRVIGKMWSECFCTVESVTQIQATFYNIYKQTSYQLSNFEEVVQFELECSFFRYQAFYHYQVVSNETADSMLRDLQNSGNLLQ
jgi:hypothetical protein